MWQALSVDSTEGSPFTSLDKKEPQFTLNPVQLQDDSSEGVATPCLWDRRLLPPPPLHPGVLANETKAEVRCGEGEGILGVTYALVIKDDNFAR